MKKIFVLIACLSLVLLTVGTVSAAITDSSSTEVTYSVSSSYHLVVPATVAIPEDDEISLSISVENAVIGDGQEIIVTIHSGQFDDEAPDNNNNFGLWAMKSGDKKLHYHIHKFVSEGGSAVEKSVKNGGIVFNATGTQFANAVDGVGHHTHSVTQYVFLSLHSEEMFSGTYSDRLEFTASLRNVAP